MNTLPRLTDSASSTADSNVEMLNREAYTRRVTTSLIAPHPGYILILSIGLTLMLYHGYTLMSLLSASLFAATSTRRPIPIARYNDNSRTTPASSHKRNIHPFYRFFHRTRHRNNNISYKTKNPSRHQPYAMQRNHTTHEVSFRQNPIRHTRPIHGTMPALTRQQRRGDDPPNPTRLRHIHSTSVTPLRTTTTAILNTTNGQRPLPSRIHTRSISRTEGRCNLTRLPRFPISSGSPLSFLV